MHNVTQSCWGHKTSVKCRQEHTGACCLAAMRERGIDFGSLTLYTTLIMLTSGY